MAVANAQMDLPKMNSSLQQFAQQQELAGMREEYVSFSLIIVNYM